MPASVYESLFDTGIPTGHSKDLKGAGGGIVRKDIKQVRSCEIESSVFPFDPSHTHTHTVSFTHTVSLSHTHTVTHLSI